MVLLKSFGQASSKKNEHFSFFIREKSFPKLLLNIISPDYFVISIKNINNMKQK